MDKILIARFKDGSDVERAAAALRQFGLEEVDQLDFTGEGFAIEATPGDQEVNLRIQIDEGQVNQTASILKKSGGRLIHQTATQRAGSDDDHHLSA
jgi:hypothetical protein